MFTVSSPWLPDFIAVGVFLSSQTISPTNTSFPAVMIDNTPNLLCKTLGFSYFNFIVLFLWTVVKAVLLTHETHFTIPKNTSQALLVDILRPSLLKLKLLRLYTTVCLSLLEARYRGALAGKRYLFWELCYR